MEVGEKLSDFILKPEIPNYRKQVEAFVGGVKSRLERLELKE